MTNFQWKLMFPSPFVPARIGFSIFSSFFVVVVVVDYQYMYERGFVTNSIEQQKKKMFMYFYLNELHGWMTQWPAVFWRIRSLTNAFLLPNNFIANRLSVGWNHDCSWFFKKFDDIFSLIVCMFGNSSSLGVPYNETSSKWTYI